MLSRATRPYLPFAVGVVSILSCLLAPSIARGQTDDVVRVEEDWELVVGKPETAVTGPQVCCVLSPTSNTDGVHMLLNINHQTMPEFVAGGMELQVWNGDRAFVDRKSRPGNVLATPGEVVVWTQAMRISPGNLTFEVINGKSTTWGEFGGGGALQAHASTTLQNLNNYNPNVSLISSGVTYAENRVESLRLKRVRIYRQSGEVQELAL